MENFCRTLILFLLTLGSILGTSIPVFSEASDGVNFIPPDEAISGQRLIGGSPRCGCIKYDRNLPPLMALVPRLSDFSVYHRHDRSTHSFLNTSTPFLKGQGTIMPGQNIWRGGLTTQSFPSLFIYIPKTNAIIGEFLLIEHLKEGSTQELYYAEFPLPTESGIVRIASPIALEKGKTYEWHLALICDPEDRNGDAVASGTIKRVALSPQLQSQIDRASLTTQLELYGEAGLWYDFFTLLAENRQRSRFFRETWKTVLQREFGQDSRIHRAAFLPCCSTITREE